MNVLRTWRAKMLATISILLAVAAIRGLSGDPEPFSSQNASVVSHEARTTGTNRVIDSSPSRLAGVIKDATGRPVAQASVQVSRDAAVLATVASDSSGRFSTTAPAGPVQLRIGARGYTPVLLQSFAPTLDVEVTLYPGHELSGVVLYERTLQPVPAVTVIASVDPRDSDDLQNATALTDDHGRFTIEGAPRGRVFLHVAGRGVWGRAKTTVDVGDSNDPVRILVVPAATVSGRIVVADTGEPCAQGQLQLLPEELFDGDMASNLQPVFEMETAQPSVPPLSAKIGRDGAVALPNVPDGQYRVGVMCDQYVPAVGPTTFNMRGDDITNQEWRVTRGIGIAVNVTDESGRAIANAGLALTPVSTAPPAASAVARMEQATLVAHADDQGFHRFVRLKEGMYRVVASDPGTGSVQVHKEITARQGDDAATTLVLPVIGSIHVQATTPDGKPVSRVLFHACDASNRRFEARYVGGGRYEIGSLPRGSYRVYAYDNKNPKLPVRGPSGSQVNIDGPEPVRLEFQYEAPRGAIEGTVVDAAGRPAAAAVQAVSTTLDDQDEQYSVVQIETHGEHYRITDDNGRFRVENVQPEASYRLFVQGRDGQKIERRNVTAGQFVHVVLPSLGAISGIAVDANGVALNDFAIVVFSTDVAEQRSQEFRATDGRFTLTHINPGNVEIAVLAAERRLHGRLVTQLLPGEMRTGLKLVAVQPVQADAPMH